jgi:hypothetical protein
MNDGSTHEILTIWWFGNAVGAGRERRDYATRRETRPWSGMRPISGK